MEKKFFCCPECGTRYQVELNSRQVACKKCGHLMTLGPNAILKSKQSPLAWIQLVLLIVLVMLTGLNMFNYYKAQAEVNKYLSAFEPISEYITSGIEELAEEAKTAACMQNQASIESAAAIAYADNVIGGSTEGFPAWQTLVRDYLGGIKPECSEGGRYIYDRSNGTVRCSLPEHRR